MICAARKHESLKHIYPPRGKGCTLINKQYNPYGVCAELRKSCIALFTVCPIIWTCYLATGCYLSHFYCGLYLRTSWSYMVWLVTGTVSWSFLPYVLCFKWPDSWWKTGQASACCSSFPLLIRLPNSHCIWKWPACANTQGTCCLIHKCKISETLMAV